MGKAGYPCAHRLTESKGKGLASNPCCSPHGSIKETQDQPENFHLSWQTARIRKQNTNTVLTELPLRSKFPDEVGGKVDEEEEDWHRVAGDCHISCNLP